MNQHAKLTPVVIIQIIPLLSTGVVAHHINQAIG